MGGTIDRNMNNQTEISNRIAAATVTWKKLMPLWKDAACSTRWKIMVYDAIIKTELEYGLETLQLSQNDLISLAAFQIKGLLHDLLL